MIAQIQGLKETLKKQYGMEINILSSDVGDVTASDIEQAELFKATIVCFNSKISPDAVRGGKPTCQIKTHKLIHTFLEDIKALCVQRQQQIDGE